MKQCEIDMSYINEHILRVEKLLDSYVIGTPEYNKILILYKELLSIRDKLIEQQNILLEIHKELTEMDVKDISKKVFTTDCEEYCK